MTTRNRTVTHEECTVSMADMKKSVRTGIVIVISIVAVVTPVSASVFGYFVSENNEKVNKIAVASIKSDDKLTADIDEVRCIAIENAKAIAAQNAKYNSDMKWLISTLTTIKDDIKDIKDKEK